MVFTDAGFSRVISKFRLSASRGGRERVRAHAFNICKLAVAVAVAVYSRARACVRVCTCVYVAGYTYVHIGRPPWGGLRSLNAV